MFLFGVFVWCHHPLVYFSLLFLFGERHEREWGPTYAYTILSYPGGSLIHSSESETRKPSTGLSLYVQKKNNCVFSMQTNNNPNLVATKFLSSSSLAEKKEETVRVSFLHSIPPIFTSLSVNPLQPHPSRFLRKKPRFHTPTRFLSFAFLFSKKKRRRRCSLKRIMSKWPPTNQSPPSLTHTAFALRSPTLPFSHTLLSKLFQYFAEKAVLPHFSLLLFNPFPPILLFF